jgi:hypothetical protein
MKAGPIQRPSVTAQPGAWRCSSVSTAPGFRQFDVALLSARRRASSSENRLLASFDWP